MDTIFTSMVMLWVLGACAAFLSYNLGKANGWRQGVQVYKPVVEAQDKAIEGQRKEVEALNDQVSALNSLVQVRSELETQLRKQIELLVQGREANERTITAQAETIKILQSASELSM